MKYYQTISALKNQAKDKLTGKFANALWTLVLVSLITRAVTNTFTAFLPTEGWIWSIISLLLTAALSVFLGALQTGIAYYFLNIACNMNYSNHNIFYGFQNKPERSFKVSLVHVIIECIYILPFQILALLFIRTFDYKYIIIAYAIMLLGTIFFAPLRLALSQTYYLLLDFPDATAKEALQTSMRIMKGHKWRLFKLELSFLPLQIVCLLSLGIGFLWLNPYMRMTQTLFFLDLMNPQSDVQSQNYAGV